MPAQQTPGPWRLESEDPAIAELNCEASSRIVGANDELVADNCPFYPHAISDADAPLLAAAWDLLAALKRLDAREPYYCWQCCNEDRAFTLGPDEPHQADCPRLQARMAITKALNAPRP